MSFCRLAGYGKKEEILGQNVGVLMPELYRESHREFMRVATQRVREDGLSAKDRQVFCCHTSGYVFPVWLQLKFLVTVMNVHLFVGSFKIEKRLVNAKVAHLLVGPDKTIAEISSSCMTLLDLNLEKVQKRRN